MNENRLDALFLNIISQIKALSSLLSGAFLIKTIVALPISAPVPFITLIFCSSVYYDVSVTLYYVNVLAQKESVLNSDIIFMRTLSFDNQETYKNLHKMSTLSLNPGKNIRRLVHHA